MELRSSLEITHKTVYKIVNGEPSVVEAEVTKLLGEGWKLEGNLTMGVVPNRDLVVCAQALTKAGSK